MTTFDEPKIKMLGSSFVYLGLHKETLKSIPGFLPEYEKFSDTVNQIEKFNSELAVSILGVTKGKQNTRDRLSVNILELSRKLSDLAKFNDNAKLFGEIHLTESKVKLMSDLALISTAEILYNKCLENEKELVPYGVDVNTASGLYDLLKNFREEQSAPRVSISSRSECRTQLRDKIREACEILTKLDLIMETIKITQPAIHRGFRTSRKIVGLAKTKYRLLGKVFDTATLEPVKGVKLIFTLSGNGAAPAAELHSADRGGFRYKSLPPGVYNVAVSKPGFTAKIQTVAVPEYEVTRVEIGIERM